jgi:hemoglobin
LAASDELPIYELLGEATLAAIVGGFYRRVATDPILRPMYPERDLAGAEERLREFLVYRFGGPPSYLQKRGHPRLRMRHMPFPIDRAARDRWIELMTAAIAEQGVEQRIADYLQQFLGDIATFLINSGA